VRDGRYEKGDLVRTRGGGVVHRASCRILKRTVYTSPWRWAEGKTPGEVKDLGFASPCRVCRPLTHEGWEQT